MNQATKIAMGTGTILLTAEVLATLAIFSTAGFNKSGAGAAAGPIAAIPGTIIALAAMLLSGMQDHTPPKDAANSIIAPATWITVPLVLVYPLSTTLTGMPEGITTQISLYTTLAIFVIATAILYMTSTAAPASEDDRRKIQAPG